MFVAKTVLSWAWVIGLFVGVEMQVKAVLFDLFDTLLLLERQEAYYLPSLRRLHEFLVKKGVNVSFEDFGCGSF